MARCKRRVAIDSYPSNATTGAQISVGTDVVELTIRAVDAVGIAVAWQLGLGDGLNRWHFAAGESYTEERIALSDPLELVVVSAAGGQVEVVRWET